jgi:hypothetical protein
VLCLHPLHVSVTEIAFDEKDKSLEIMMRVFADDLETTLRKTYNKPELDILSPKSSQITDQLAGQYLQKHLLLSLDKKQQDVRYLGHELEGDAFTFYLEVTDVKKWKTIRISNDMLTETFDDQSNLVHVTVKDEVKSLRLTRNTSVDILTFDSK